MKKVLIASLSLALIFSLGSCKSKKSAYRQAYEQAKQREIATQESTTNAVAFEEGRLTRESPTPPTTPISVRKERVSTVDGENTNYLRRYSVVIGSFQNPTNARALKERMVARGYNAVLARNEVGMMRVIVSSFDSREEAAASREAIKARFAPEFSDAWILENA